MSVHAACDSYSVPEHVREHIDIVLPTVNFDARVSPRTESSPLMRRATPAPRSGFTRPNSFAKTDGRKAQHSDASLANCDQQITLDCLRALYDFQYTPVATDKNSYGIGAPFPLLLCTNRELTIVPSQSNTHLRVRPLRRSLELCLTPCSIPAGGL
jgi:hypothetical protein